MPDEMPSLEPSITFNARSGKILESESSEPWWVRLIFSPETKALGLFLCFWMFFGFLRDLETLTFTGGFESRRHGLEIRSQGQRAHGSDIAQGISQDDNNFQGVRKINPVEHDDEDGGFFKRSDY